MEALAYQKQIRTSARKMRLVADAVREMSPEKALVTLKFMHKRAAGVLWKVVKQAVANANANDSKLQSGDLKFKHIIIEEGSTYKRFRAASRGRARQILKRTSNIKVIVTNK